MRKAILLLSALSLCACADEADNLKPQPQEDPIENRQEEEDPWAEGITLSTDSLMLGGRVDTQGVEIAQRGWWINSVEVEGEVTLTTEAERQAMSRGEAYRNVFDWVTVSTEPDAIIVSVTANPSSDAPRTFHIEVQGGDKTKVITGTQEPLRVGDWGDQVFLSRNVLFFPADGGHETVTTGTSRWWLGNISIDENWYRPSQQEANALEKGNLEATYEWLHVHITDDPATEGRTLELTVEPNNTGNPRTFDISIQAGDYFCHIDGTQPSQGTWEDVIGLSQREATFPREGGSATVTTATDLWTHRFTDIDGHTREFNVKETEDFENGNVEKTFEWLHLRITDDPATGGRTLEMTADRNYTGSPRSFTIYLQAGNYFDCITGRQD